MQQQATSHTPRRPHAYTATDRLRRGPHRKASAEMFMGAPGALRRLLNGASVVLTDADAVQRLRAVRASELSRSGALSNLFLDDLDGAEVAARWARRFGSAA